MSKVPLTRPFLLAKHATLPCQLVPGVGTQRLIHAKFSSPGKRAFDPTLIRKNGCQPTLQWRPTATAHTSPDQPARALPTRAAPLALARPAVLPNTVARTPAVPLGALSRPPGSHTHS